MTVSHVTIIGIKSVLAGKSLLYRLYAPGEVDLPFSKAACSGLHLTGGISEIAADSLMHFLRDNTDKYLDSITRDKYKSLCAECRVILDAALDGVNMLPTFHKGKYK